MKNNIIEMQKRKWLFPLFSTVLALGIMTPIKAIYIEKSWFAPSIGQATLPVILFSFLVGVIGFSFGLLIDRYESVLQSKRMLIYGIVIGAVISSFLLGGEMLITLVVLILFIGELMLCNQSFSDIYADILMGLALAVFVQVCFLDKELALMNSSPKWDIKSGQAVLSFYIWLLCLMAPAVLRMFCGGKVQKCLHLALGCGVSFATIVMTILVFCGIGVPESGQWYISKDGEFDLSSEDNIVFFVVDQLDDSWIETYIAEEPMYHEMLSGFVRFNNVVAPSSTSWYNIPALLTGEINTGFINQNEFYSHIYSGNTMLSDLKSNGYDVRIYSNKVHLVNNAVVGSPTGIDNLIVNPARDVTSFGTLVSNVFNLAGYYAVPYQYKKAFMYNTKDAEINLPISNGVIYREDYQEYKEDYAASGLKVMENGKMFKLYYIDGIHVNLDEEDESSVVAFRKGLNKRFSIISDYIAELKEKNLFDQTTIIILGGNGANQLRQNPAMLIKMKGSQDEYTVNDVPVTFDNISATIMTGLEGSLSYGSDIFKAEQPDEEKARMVIVEKDIRNAYYADQLAINEMSRFLIGGNATEEEKIFEARISPVYDYLLNEPIMFWREGAHTDIGSGLSGVEPDLRWTDTTGVDMRFHIDEPFEDLRAHIYYNWTYVLPQQILVYANQKLVYNNIHDGYFPIEFTVPHEWVENGDLELVICLPDAVIPAMVSESPDTRRLGLSLDAMMIESVSRETETVQETNAKE